MKSAALAFAAVVTVAVGSPAFATNLISNGDFQSGNTGFTSDYSYNTINSTGFGPELVEGAYSVVEKASDVHFAWLGDFYDHTLGTSSGRYFVANASPDTSLAVWESNAITVSQANTPYRFEAWISKIYQYESNPPQLTFQIGDGSSWTNLGATASLDEVNPGEWLFTYADGQFASAGTYYVRLENANGVDGGNDLGLDDIYFGLRSASPSVGTEPGSASVPTYNVSSVPEPSGWVMAAVGIAFSGLVIGRRRRCVPA